MITSPSVGTQINDILGRYGLLGGFLGAQVDTLLGNPIGALTTLRRLSRSSSWTRNKQI